MFKIQIDERGLETVAMADGKVVPVAYGYVSTTDADGLLIVYPNGAEVWFTAWDGSVGPFNVVSLADGETWEDLGVTRRGDTYMVDEPSHIGPSMWVRCGDEMLVVTPGLQLKAA